MTTGAAPDTFLPDFCHSRRVLAVLAICELVALILALARLEGGGGFWTELFLFSVYVQWIGVCSAAALCLIRRHLAWMDGRVVALVCYSALLAVTFAISEITFVAAPRTGIAPLVAGVGHLDFLLRNLGVCAVVAALGLRYFWLRDVWQRQAAAEMEARYLALQARIRPHFLFNSLNSVAALIAVRPDDAESAIEDLSELLRANLADTERPTVTFREELELARAYVRLETLRLGERLRLDWQLDSAAAEWPVPPLSLQPLIENAIRHGIARLREGGTVTVRVGCSAASLEIAVANPMPADAVTPGGFRLALDNIRERLALRYGSEAALRTRAADSRFEVQLSLPPAPGETK